MIKRRLALLLAAVASMAAAAAPADATERKVLRLAFTRAETSLDPARIVDLYSRNITAHIFEALFTYDHLARPVKIKPLTAQVLPEHSDDYRVWTVKIKPGIYFAADPAFKGQQRELVAADYVYAFKRLVDPKNKSPIAASILETKFVGLAALHDEAVKGRKPFDYDRPVPGLRALDRYTLRIELEEPRPGFVEDTLSGSDLVGAVAREVVEYYGDQIGEHPVGTGPFKLKSWRRSSEIVLERNPDYRVVLYDADPGPDDNEGQAILASFKGRRLPMIDEVRVAIIEQSQPMWLSFLNAEVDALATIAGRVPPEFLAQAMPGGRLAPYLAKRGIQGLRTLNSDSSLAVFNMNDPVVGGYTPEKIALRRAISLAFDSDHEIRIRRGGIRAQSPVLPHTTGYDPKFKSEMGDYDPARARALLELYGYRDRDGDGWRELPDGKPLAIEMASQPDDLTKKFDEVWKKGFDSVGIRMTFKPAQWPENLKALRAGKVQFWFLGSSAASSNGQGALARLFGPQAGNQNLAFFRNAEFDRLYERMRVIPDGPEREALFLEAKRIAVAYMPYKHTIHRMEADVLHPWVVGYRRPQFGLGWWHRVDIDNSKRPAR